MRRAGFTLLLTALVSSAVAGFVPGGGNPTADCYGGLDVTGVDGATSRIECTEGDPCDFACGDGKCTFRFLICVNRTGVSGCTPPAAGLRIMTAPSFIQSSIPVDLDQGPACGRPFSFDLPLKRNGRKANRRVVRTRTTAAGATTPHKDQDTFTFVCKPRTTPCPSGVASSP